MKTPDLRAITKNMKTSPFLVLPAVLLIVSCGTSTAPEVAQAPVQTAKYTVYGDTITADNAITMAEFDRAVAGKDSADLKLSAEIISSCAKKGCWMNVKMADGGDMMVRFVDYGFFVPTAGLEGKKTVMQGRAKRDITDVAMLRHYAEDAGKSPEEIAKITVPDTSWTFLAEGVLIQE